MAVAEYTFTFHRDGPEPTFSQSLSFESDADAIREGGELLAAQAEFVRQPTRSICVARGSGDEVEWLGAWDWTDGVAAWVPED